MLFTSFAVHNRGNLNNVKGLCDRTNCLQGRGNGSNEMAREKHWQWVTEGTGRVFSQ